MRCQVARLASGSTTTGSKSRAWGTCRSGSPRPISSVRTPRSRGTRWLPACSSAAGSSSIGDAARSGSWSSPRKRDCWSPISRSVAGRWWSASSPWGTSRQVASAGRSRRCRGTCWRFFHVLDGPVSRRSNSDFNRACPGSSCRKTCSPCAVSDWCSWKGEHGRHDGVWLERAIGSPGDFQSLPITFNHFQSLPITFNHFQRHLTTVLPITSNHFQITSRTSRIRSRGGAERSGFLSAPFASLRDIRCRSVAAGDGDALDDLAVAHDGVAGVLPQLLPGVRGVAEGPELVALTGLSLQLLPLAADAQRRHGRELAVVRRGAVLHPLREPLLQDLHPLRPPSRHRVAVRRRVAPGHVVLQLPLDVAQQRAGAVAEEGGAQPLRAQLLLHHQHPGDRVLGGADAAGGLEPHVVAGALAVLADAARHGEP